MSKDTGGYAFPMKRTVADQRGMTLRDWFAGQALCGMAANVILGSSPTVEWARTSYSLADAMLEERKK